MKFSFLAKVGLFIREGEIVQTGCKRFWIETCKKWSCKFQIILTCITIAVLETDLMLGTSVTGSSPHFDLQFSNIPFSASIFNWISHFDDEPSVFFAGISFSSTACTFLLLRAHFSSFFFLRVAWWCHIPILAEKKFSDLPQYAKMAVVAYI